MGQGTGNQYRDEAASDRRCRAEPVATRDAVGVSPLWIVPVVVAYLLGIVPSAHLVAGRSGLDPTKAGSGNPGATNVYRVAGRRAGIAVFGADAGKGALATALGFLVGGRPLGVACWAVATVGHVLPLTRRFRGGKGVATAGGGSWVVFPVVALCCSVLFILVARITGKASVGSITIAVALPVLVAVFGGSASEVMVSTGLAGMVVVRHQGNIRRLFSGAEDSWGPGG